MLPISCTNFARSDLPFSSRKLSSSGEESKWSSIAFFPLPVTIMILSIPEATHSSTTYWISGLSTTGSISLGCALVAGRNLVPSPAAGRTALRTRFGFSAMNDLRDRSKDTWRSRTLSIHRLHWEFLKSNQLQKMDSTLEDGELVA